MEMHTPRSLKAVHGIAPATRTGSRSSPWTRLARFLSAVASAVTRHHERSRSRDWLSGLDDRTLAYGRRRFHHH